MNKLLSLSLITVLLVTGCSKEKEKPDTIQDIHKRDGYPVTTVTVAPTTLFRTESSSGTIGGVAQTYLANALGGTVEKIYVKVGDRLSRDQRVAKMKFSTGSAIPAVQSGYDYAEKAYNRAKKLHDEGAVSQEQLEGARAQYEELKRVLRQTKALEVVTTPISGVVLEVMQEEGSNISAETPIVKVADLRKMKVDMYVNESRIHHYKKGQKAFIVLDADTVWGELASVALSATELTHGFKISAQFNNKEKLLSPGMYKEVEVVVTTKDDVLTLPIEFVNYQSDGSAWVYTIKGDQATLTPITTGIRTGTHFEITSGLTEGDKVVATGATMLSDGVKVKQIVRGE